MTCLWLSRESKNFKCGNRVLFATLGRMTVTRASAVGSDRLNNDGCALLTRNGFRASALVRWGISTLKIREKRRRGPEPAPPAESETASKLQETYR